MMCRKCTTISGVLLLLVGLGFLLVDVGVWSFLGLSWWTVLFLVIGIVGIAKSQCADCQRMCMPNKMMKK